jgi:hypothetical protein
MARKHEPGSRVEGKGRLWWSADGGALIIGPLQAFKAKYPALNNHGMQPSPVLRDLGGLSYHANITLVCEKCLHASMSRQHWFNIGITSKCQSYTIFTSGLFWPEVRCT